MDEYKMMKRQLMNTLIVTIVESYLRDPRYSNWTQEELSAEALDFAKLIIEDMEERDIYNG